MGKAGESRMTAHQEKELNLEALKEFRNRFQLDISDHKLENLDFYPPGENSEEIIMEMFRGVCKEIFFLFLTISGVKFLRNCQGRFWGNF